MAIGKASDFQIYDAEFYGGYWEGLSRNVNAFNGASNNAIRLSPAEHRGDYFRESFFDSVSSVVSRRDTTSVASATDLSLTQDEIVGVKLNRKFGPVAQTLDAWKKISEDQREMSFILGQMLAEEVTEEMLDAALIAAEAAIDNQSGLSYDATGESTTTLTPTHLVSGLNQRGDQGSKIRTWVGHSKPFYDLMKEAISGGVTNVADMAINEGNIRTLGRPFVTTDSSALTDDNGSLTDTYNTLGLVSDGVVVEESEERTVVLDLVSGLENIVYRFQAEYAFTVKLKGFKWDITNGGANPDNTALGTGSNWDLAVTDDKLAAGVHVTTE